MICLLDSEKSYFSVINPGNIYSDFDLRYVKKSGDLMTGELKIRGVNALRIFNEAFGLFFAVLKSACTLSLPVKVRAKTVISAH